MKEKILLFLKTQLPGVAENYLSGIADFYSKTILDEQTIQTTINEGVVALLKENARILQVEGDRRATDASKTALENYLKKNPPKDPAKEITKETPKEEESIGALLEKVLAEKLNPLQEKLTRLETEKLQSTIRESLFTKLKGKGIPESYYKGRDFSSLKEDELDTFSASIEEEYNSFKKELIESGVIVSIPKSPNVETKEGEAYGKAVAEARNAGKTDSVIPGKPL